MLRGCPPKNNRAVGVVDTAVLPVGLLFVPVFFSFLLVAACRFLVDQGKRYADKEDRQRG